jgi:hypothetical protein
MLKVSPKTKITKKWCDDSGIYSLMLNPSKEDLLDSVLAQRFYEGEGRYEAEILEHVKVHAKKTRKQWEEELVDS